MKRDWKHRSKRTYLCLVYVVTSLILLAGCAQPLPKIPIHHPDGGLGIMDPAHGDLQASYEVGAVQAEPHVALFFGQLLTQKLQRSQAEKNGGAIDSKATRFDAGPFYRVNATIEISSAMQLSDRFRGDDHAAICFEIVARESGILAKSFTWSHGTDQASTNLSTVLSQWVDDFVGRLYIDAVAATYGMSEGLSEYDAQGRESIAAGNYQDALARFRQAIDANPADHAALYNAGLVCEAIGDHGRALGFYRRARRLGNNPEYRRALGRVEDLLLTRKQ